MCRYFSYCKDLPSEIHNSDLNTLFHVAPLFNSWFQQALILLYIKKLKLEIGKIKRGSTFVIQNWALHPRLFAKF